ncbi:MAG TPA: hypothetical protein PLU22_06020, partial [Polyangiaceae bacterium]|nr:hypothetical protein [Polyangiaceae bacterium]
MAPAGAERTAAPWPATGSSTRSALAASAGSGSPLGDSEEEGTATTTDAAAGADALASGGRPRRARVGLRLHPPAQTDASRATSATHHADRRRSDP